jgi:hypothetical protein
MIRRMVLGWVVALLAAAGPALATAPAAHADNLVVPQPTVCYGGLYVDRSLDGTTSANLSAYATCGLHSLNFTGTAVPPVAPDFCAPQLSLSFAGAESIDGGPTTPSVWSISGHYGVFTIHTVGAGGHQRVGAFTIGNTLPTTLVTSPCFSFGFGAEYVLADPTTSGRVPAVYLCHAEGDVGQFTFLGGRAGGVTYGQLHGSGTCQSPDTARAAQLDGTWSRGADFQTSPSTCMPAGYDFTLKLTSGPRSNSWQQHWGEASALHQVFTASQAGGAGAGLVRESPNPCGPNWTVEPDPFHFTADWVFFAE